MIFFQVITNHAHQNQNKSELNQASVDTNENPRLIENKKLTDSEEEIFEGQLRKPRLRHEVGEVKNVADALRKISRPAEEIVFHPKPR